jgi:hypothetical protein
VVVSLKADQFEQEAGVIGDAISRLDRVEQASSELFV